jgi:GLPGLI family protein
MPSLSIAQVSKVTCVKYKVDRYTFEGEKTFKEDDALKAFRSLEYKLIYDNTHSLYKPVDRLPNSPDNDEYKFAKFMVGYYFLKDNAKKLKIEKSEIQNEPFYIVRDWDEYKWTITDEFKIIDGYKCYKATSVKIDSSATKKRVIRFTPVVWFAPSIPAPFGPSGLDGLPGLVLEATFNGRIYYYATSITFDCNEEVDFEKPSKGKFVTEQEFKKISSEKFKEEISVSK